MKYKIIPVDMQDIEIAADSAEDAICAFATVMDTDMNRYFRAVTEEEYQKIVEEKSDAAAHARFVTAFMRDELVSTFDVPEGDADALAETTYELYKQGNGRTEYQCIEEAHDEYRERNEDVEDSDDDEIGDEEVSRDENGGFTLIDDELAYKIGNRFVSIQETSEGYDYTVYDANYREIDGGQIDDFGKDIYTALDQIAADYNCTGDREKVDYEELQEKTEKVWKEEQIKTFLLWARNDDTEPMLVGVADSMAKAVLMQGKSEEYFEDTLEYDIQPFKKNTVTINNVDYAF